MDLNDIVDRFGAFKKKVDAIHKALLQIRRLDPERLRHLKLLRRSAAKVPSLITTLSEATKERDALVSWLEQYKAELDAAPAQLQEQLGPALESELRLMGVTLKGQYPRLRAGLFTILIDFANLKATLWYGPQQERIGECQLDAAEIARLIKVTQESLGSGLPPEEFLDRLYSVYQREAATAQESIRITSLLDGIASAIQQTRCGNDPRSTNCRPYGRADFSYDLFRCRSPRIHLTVATRSHTRTRRDFLWVPTNAEGEGNTYSYLKFEQSSK